MVAVLIVVISPQISSWAFSTPSNFVVPDFIDLELLYFHALLQERAQTLFDAQTIRLSISPGSVKLAEVRWQRLCTQKGVSYLVHGKRSFSAYQGQVNWEKETLSARDWVMKTSETPMGWSDRSNITTTIKVGSEWRPQRRSQSTITIRVAKEFSVIRDEPK